MAGKTTRILKDLAVSAGAAGFGYALQKLHEREEKRKLKARVPRRTRASFGIDKPGESKFDERINI